jgi:hypothetical protein
MRAKRERGVLSWLLIAFAIGGATMAGMKAINWLVPDPPQRIEIHTNVSERFA